MSSRTQVYCSSCEKVLNYGTITLYGGLFQDPSSNLFNLARPYGLTVSYNPRVSRPGRKQKHILKRLDPYILKNRLFATYAQDETHEFGLFPFRSPLLGESLLLSFPPGTKMFQFPGCLLPLKVECYGFTIAGFPIRKSPDQSLLSAPRRLSQTTTSFISHICQDILYVLFCELLTTVPSQREYGSLLVPSIARELTLPNC